MTSVEERLKQVMGGKNPTESNLIEPESTVFEPVRFVAKALALVYIPTSFFRWTENIIENKYNVTDRGKKGAYAIASLCEGMRGIVEYIWIKNYYSMFKDFLNN